MAGPARPRPAPPLGLPEYLKKILNAQVYDPATLTCRVRSSARWRRTRPTT